MTVMVKIGKLVCMLVIVVLVNKIVIKYHIGRTMFEAIASNKETNDFYLRVVSPNRIIGDKQCDRKNFIYEKNKILDNGVYYFRILVTNFI